MRRLFLLHKRTHSYWLVSQRFKKTHIKAICTSPFKCENKVLRTKDHRSQIMKRNTKYYFPTSLCQFIPRDSLEVSGWIVWLRLGSLRGIGRKSSQCYLSIAQVTHQVSCSFPGSTHPSEYKTILHWKSSLCSARWRWDYFILGLLL